jgi:hypothetical protein
MSVGVAIGVAVSMAVGVPIGVAVSFTAGVMAVGLTISLAFGRAAGLNVGGIVPQVSDDLLNDVLQRIRSGAEAQLGRSRLAWHDRDFRDSRCLEHAMNEPAANRAIGIAEERAAGQADEPAGRERNGQVRYAHEVRTRTLGSRWPAALPRKVILMGNSERSAPVGT